MPKRGGWMCFMHKYDGCAYMHALKHFRKNSSKVLRFVFSHLQLQRDVLCGGKQVRRLTFNIIDIYCIYSCWERKKKNAELKRGSNVITGYGDLLQQRRRWDHNGRKMKRMRRMPFLKFFACKVWATVVCYILSVLFLFLSLNQENLPENFYHIILGQLLRKPEEVVLSRPILAPTQSYRTQSVSWSPLTQYCISHHVNQY